MQLKGIDDQIRLIKLDPTPNGLGEMHKERIYTELRQLGADWYDMQLPETHVLPRVIHINERLVGVVYGRYKQKGRYGQEPKTLSLGRGALVVTDKRVLFIDRKPLWLRCDEIPRDIISGVTYNQAWPAATIALHTRAGDFSIRTFNLRCAGSFVEAVEAVCFEHEGWK